MGASAGGRLARGLAVALVGLALPASASAAAGVTKLSPTSQTLTIPSAAGEARLRDADGAGHPLKA